MGKRKGRISETSETLKICKVEDKDGGESMKELEEGEKSGFFACYLLTSLCPRFKGHTYIGFTVNPRRRIRQHNGELCSGAFRTKKKRPWEMVLCIYGFPTNVAALQFEWAWQHPVESLAVRKAAVAFKSLGGLTNKIKLAYTMLTLSHWQNLNLTVNFFSTKYTQHYAGCPTLPKHMRVHIRSMDELPCYTEGSNDIFKFQNDLWDDDDDDELDRNGGSNESEGVRLEDLMRLENQEPPSCSSNSPDNTRNSHDRIRQQKSESTGDIDITDVFGKSITNTSNPLEMANSSFFSTSPERFPSLFSNNYGSVASPTIGDENGLMDHIRENMSAMAADKDELTTKIDPLSGEVEVIDLFTPSPEYKISLRRKKRAVSIACPQIIDLTQSPILV